MTGPAERPMHAVTVIIVNWNSGAWLAQAVAGLGRQTRRDFRLMVVDNASTDDSVARARALDVPFELMALPENAGFARANNLAAAEANSEWLALLNPDAVPAPDWLEQLLAAAGRQPRYDFFGSRQLMAEDARRLDGVGDYYHVSGMASRIGRGRHTTARDLVEREIFSPCAAAALYRRSAFLAAGGFDERYFCYFEDVDLGFRLRLRGHRALYVPTAVVRHAGAAITGRNSAFGIYHGHRNLVWTYVKNMPAPLFWLCLPAHVLLNLLALAWFIARGHGRTILRAKRDALLGLPLMLATRREVQASRRASCHDMLAAMSVVLPG